MAFIRSMMLSAFVFSMGMFTIGLVVGVFAASLYYLTVGAIFILLALESATLDRLRITMEESA